MILCDFCHSKIEKVDEHDLILFSVFKEAGLRVRMTIEAVSGALIRHICQKCRFKILDRTMKNPLTEVPEFEVKVRRD